MSTLLPFHTHILNEIHDPSTSELVILGRGLGLRRVLCTLMKIYDSTQNLVLVVNATQQEEGELIEELQIMGCRKPGLRSVDYEMGTSKHRQDLYKGGGLISVTSRILVVDMLQKDIPIELITGIIVLHADEVTPLHTLSFIARLYREGNDKGFLKAFTDRPEAITHEFSPLKTILKELKLRKVHIYPRFHDEIKKVLERKRADVIELYQHLSESMSEIHDAVIQCLNATIAELKKSRNELDLDMLALPAAYFPQFDYTVRKQLDPIWNKVGKSTKALMRDLKTLRNMTNYLLSYDSVRFHSYCELIIASAKEEKELSPWIMSDAANTIFKNAKRRCYVETASRMDDGQGGWDADAEEAGRPQWLPQGMEPVLEELPKWTLLSEVLEEIEGEIIQIEGNKSFGKTPGTNTTLIMCASTAAAHLIEEFLDALDQSKPVGQYGRRMMLRKLKWWLYWKNKSTREGKTAAQAAAAAGLFVDDEPPEDDILDEALKKKDQERKDQRARRRRVRGGAPAGPSREPSVPPVTAQPEDVWAVDDMQLLNMDVDDDAAFQQLLTQSTTDFDTHFGLLAPQETVIVRAFADDSDDRVLDEIKPRFIVMMEPNMEFIRRIEVYRCAHPGLSVRVYHMVYANTCEEHKYLAGIRREKESFERLIRERGNMLMPIYGDPRLESSDAVIKTISSRIAGGQQKLNAESSKVVVDMREFRSTLPSLLHASNLSVVPATLTVGDYILTPEICVERKSLSDLVSSFNNGRLFTQCEIMSLHYKDPVLLIEFEEDKAFTLEIVSDIKRYGRAPGRFQNNKAKDGGGKTAPVASQFDGSTPTIQAKLAMLVLTFPRVRIIWASSPYATAEIFKDLKADRAEPDAARAITVGAEEDPDVGAGVNAAAEELLKSLPGITEKNVKYVMGKVKNVREFSALSLRELQEILGTDSGRICYQFMHKGDR